MSEAEKAPEPETGSTNSPEVSQPAEASSDPAKASTPTEDSNPVSESGGDGPVTKETAKSSEDKDAGEETSNETEEEDNKDPSPTEAPALPSPIVSSSKKSRPPYKYDPDKITLRFLFANRDGLTVTVESKPVDTVGEVKAALLSVWPEDLPDCGDGDRVRLICMGKGVLSPDSKTLEDCQIPVFKTHPTPINVSVRPDSSTIESSKGGNDNSKRASSSTHGGSGGQTSQGCACAIL